MRRTALSFLVFFSFIYSPSYAVEMTVGNTTPVGGAFLITDAPFDFLSNRQEVTHRMTATGLAFRQTGSARLFEVVNTILDPNPPLVDQRVMTVSNGFQVVTQGDESFPECNAHLAEAEGVFALPGMETFGGPPQLVDFTLEQPRFLLINLTAGCTLFWGSVF